MPEFERRTTLALDADAAFELLAEPAKLPLWLVGVSLEESISVDGDPLQQDEGEAAPTAAAARFVTDREARRVVWVAPSGDYAATLEVQSMMPGMSAVSVRLETRDPVDAAAASTALDEMVKRLQRALTG